ncbi:MAG: Mrp/NBP35 family ATP-binding protein [Acidobacteriota bacterium]|nr:Mrp/NBP35 family ATP-binding protein [Acidobacteriota bacterium]
MNAQSGGPQFEGPQEIPGIKSIIAVGSGKGGVGKTTLSVNLALALARLGNKVGLLDADIYGPNIPLMLGEGGSPDLTPDNRLIPPERYGLRVISIGYLTPGDKPLVWRGPMLHGVIKQFLSQVEWGELDYLIVDLPPGTGDVVISLTQSVPLTGAVVVTTPSGVSLQDARKAIEMFKEVRVELLGIVENMSYLMCPHCNHEIDVFSSGGGERTAKAYGVPFLGRIEMDPTIREGGDSGYPVVLNGEQANNAKSLFAFARKVKERADEVKSAGTGGVLSID